MTGCHELQKFREQSVKFFDNASTRNLNVNY